MSLFVSIHFSYRILCYNLRPHICHQEAFLKRDIVTTLFRIRDFLPQRYSMLREKATCKKLASSDKKTRCSRMCPVAKRSFSHMLKTKTSQLFEFFLSVPLYAWQYFYFQINSVNIWMWSMLRWEMLVLKTHFRCFLRFMTIL